MYLNLARSQYSAQITLIVFTSFSILPSSSVFMDEVGGRLSCCSQYWPLNHLAYSYKMILLNCILNKSNNSFLNWSFIFTFSLIIIVLCAIQYLYFIFYLVHSLFMLLPSFVTLWLATYVQHLSAFLPPKFVLILYNLTASRASCN